MYTSNFANVGSIRPPLEPIAIARGHPRCRGGWKAALAPGVVGRSDSRLAPSWKSLKATDEEYDRAFAAILAGLNPRRVYDELSENAVLLCFCEPNVFCHRRLVAEWFEFHLGVIVAELGVDRIDTPMCVTPAFDFHQTTAAKYAWLETKLGLAPGSTL